ACTLPISMTRTSARAVSVTPLVSFALTPGPHGTRKTDTGCLRRCRFRGLNSRRTLAPERQRPASRTSRRSSRAWTKRPESRHSERLSARRVTHKSSQNWLTGCVERHDMIAKGTYTAKAIEWKLGVTSRGTEQIAVLFQLESGEQITWYGYFTEKTTERTLDALEYMGWDGVDITDPVGLDRNDVRLVIDHETGEDGKTYARVKWVNRIGGLAVKEELTGGARSEEHTSEQSRENIVCRRLLEK